ncbi:putative Ctr copper transporter [Rhizodiscina lignyota]|uniref:Copper transport protein n=1 Tax=Rhizodiscina lignyota TaxID=1504668 RepID=A0A9P4M587_9PEZI|nr:putative Ctr copper transporter [Rhizodiscina lignyota]
MSTVPLSQATTSMDMSMPTTTASMDMSGMSMAASDMSMTFFGGTGTSLYSMQFTPSTTGGYAGACIFLIVLAILYRCLFAFKQVLENRWMAAAINRRYVVVADKTPESERIRASQDSKIAVLSANGIEEEVKIAYRPRPATMPWRFSVDLPRSFLVMVILGVGYLLMLAVMTLNVGYFGSVLAGAFIGELLVGRFNVHMEEHH